MAGCGVIPLPATVKRRIVVVADPGRESAGALEWALYHAVGEQDEIILLHVEPAQPRRVPPFQAFLRLPPFPPAPGLFPSAVGGGGENYEFLDEMRAMCGAAQPKVMVQVERVAMEKDKAETILMQTKALHADILVVGQHRNAITSSLSKLNGSVSSAETLIRTSDCVCVGVHKKGQNGGYLINTKTLKNFWLLA